MMTTIIYLRDFLAISLKMGIIRHVWIAPQRQHRDRQFAGYRHFGFLPGDAPASLRYPVTEIPQIAISPKGAHYILRPLYEQSPQQFIAAFRYSELLIHLAGLIPLGGQTSV